MDLKPLNQQFDGIAELALLPNGVHFLIAGKVEMQTMDSERLVSALTGLLASLDKVEPGIAARHGWAKIEDLRDFGNAIGDASKASKPNGMV
jgi:hypothetical protein